MMSNQNKAQNIISKLKSLECPILENSDDGWAMEVLFKPSFERYHIFEWIFSKLEFCIPDVSRNQNSSERKAENLLAAVSALGLCREKDSGVIQGTSPLNEQLRLWNLLVNILWKKCSLSQKRGNTSVDSISEEYNRSREYICKLCDNVSFKALFDKKVQLFPPHVLRDCKEACGTLSSEVKTLEDIKALSSAVLKNNATDTGIKISHISKDLDTIEFNSSVFSKNDKLIALEDNISSSLLDLQKHACSEFNEAYLNLKPHLSNISHDESVDAGSSFKNAQLQLESLTNLNKSLSSLKESESELNTLNSNFEKFHLPTEPLSDSLLGKFLTILNNCKQKDEEK